MPLNEEEPISSGLQKLLFLYPGAIEDIGTDIGRRFVPLVTMGRRTGTVRFDDCVTRNLFGQMDLRSRAQIKEFEKPTGDPYVLAAALRIEAESEPAAEDISQSESERAAAIKVVVVSDMDILAGVFFLLRERASFFGDRFSKWQVDNVPFVLNILDDLAEDTRFIDIRKRRPVHRELTAIKQVSDAAKRNRDSARKEAENKFNHLIDDEQEKLDKIAESLQARRDISPQQMQEEMAIAHRNGTSRIEARKAQLDREEQAEYRRIENEMAADIHRVQDRYKLMAVLLPPIPPLLIALCVFFVRRAREKESASSSRQR